KLFGIVFLGNARTAAISRAGEAGIAMVLPMLLGALACLAIGVRPEGVLRLLAPVVASISGAGPPPDAIGALSAITRVAVVLLALVAIVSQLRHLLLRGREIRT